MNLTLPALKRRGYQAPSFFCVDEQRETLELVPKMEAILFCPDEGGTCWEVIANKRITYPVHQVAIDLVDRFRKPDIGMLVAVSCSAFKLGVSGAELLVWPRSFQQFRCRLA